jgi:hypothetical protein
VLTFKKKNMNSYKYISIILVLATSLVACTKDFEEINTNPHAPVEAQPSLLLRQVIYNTGEEMSYEGFVAGNLLSQHFTMVDFNLFDRHNLAQPQLGGNPWSILYQNLRDNEILLSKARSSSAFEVYEGPAMILKAHLAGMLTDIYGDMPYFQAFDGKNGTTTPVYDSQMAIYSAEGGILDLLAKGVEKVVNFKGSFNLEGDVLFHGDLTAWQKFGNSLRIKYLMRSSTKLSNSVALQEIVNDMQYQNNNFENAVFDFTNGQPNNFRMANLRDGDFNLYIMSETAEDIFTKYNDPRVEVFFRQISNNTTGAILYKGLLNGPDASATSISIADYSLAGRIFREETGRLDANYMTAWETNFLLAEAAEKGIISGSAKGYYDGAVQQAFDYWGIAMPTDYLTTGAAVYGTNNLELIAEQKWIANCINGYESWIEFRRTGFPALKTVSASLNGDLIPVRMPYPTSEQALNADNYAVAAASYGGNSVNAKTWWDR